MLEDWEKEKIIFGYRIRFRLQFPEFCQTALYDSTIPIGQCVSSCLSPSCRAINASKPHRILQPQVLFTYSRQSAISTFMTAVYLWDPAFGNWATQVPSASGRVIDRQVVACLPSLLSQRSYFDNSGFKPLVLVSSEEPEIQTNSAHDLFGLEQNPYG